MNYVADPQPIFEVAGVVVPAYARRQTLSGISYPLQELPDILQRPQDVPIFMNVHVHLYYNKQGNCALCVPTGS